MYYAHMYPMTFFSSPGVARMAAFSCETSPANVGAAADVPDMLSGVPATTTGTALAMTTKSGKPRPYTHCARDDRPGKYSVVQYRTTH